MFKKILWIFLSIIILLTLWLFLKFVASYASTPETLYTKLPQTTYFQAVAKRITDPLGIGKKLGPAQVSLEELGELSPVVGMVSFVKNTPSAKTTDMFYEYVEIIANEKNVQPINISNWSVQSLVSDEWIGIPQGAELYIANEVNELQDIYLQPGDRVIISTRQSPVGVSFRVNKCSGFLGTTQDFAPSIQSSCIDPKTVLIPTAPNLKEFGGSCVEFIEGMDRCKYVTDSLRGFESLTQACREYIQPRLTYNFCSASFKDDSDFYSKKNWRIFLNQDRLLWRENYEIIRLLDENNKTVDVFNY